MSNNAKIRVASGDDLDVRTFAVKQAISELFHIELRVVSRNLDIDFDDVIGKPAAFELVGPFGIPFWSGICSEIDQVRVDDQGLATYELVIVPNAWLMTQRLNYRIFQMVSELDIVQTMFGEWGIPIELRVDSASYPARKYRVQYGESDFAFVSRMMEDVGINYYFEPHGGQSVLVLDDAPEARDVTKPLLQFFDSPQGPTAEFVTRLGIRQRVRPGKVTLADLDYRKPSDNQPSLSAKAGLEVEQALEHFHYEPGTFLFKGSFSGMTPTADDRGASRVDPAAGRARTESRLAGKRANGRCITFESNAIDLVPGSRLSTRGHPQRLVANGKKLLVTRAQINGESHESWRVRAEAVPTDVPFKPEQKTPRPRVQGLESATVVGPNVEEIHTDEYGRVRVHFHWDRDGKRDETASCWIPTSQPWAGAGFGGVNLPRIGQEVLVEFLSGDPDRPVVIGRVYTETQASPYKLPDYKNVMSLRSESTPRLVMGAADGSAAGTQTSLLGEGKPMTPDEIASDVTGDGPFSAKSPNDIAHGWKGSELALHDTNGQEIAYLKAQKDFNLVVNNAWTTVVGNHRATKVGSDDELVVRNKQQINIGSDLTETVGRDHSLSVTNEQTIKVGASVTETVTHNFALTTGDSITGDTKGFIRWNADGLIVINSKVGVVLKSGESSITITPQDITIQAAEKVHINPRQGEEEEKRQADEKKAAEDAKAQAVKDAGRALMKAEAAAAQAGRGSDMNAYNQAEMNRQVAQGKFDSAVAQSDQDYGQAYQQARADYQANP